MKKNIAILMIGIILILCACGGGSSGTETDRGWKEWPMKVADARSDLEIPCKAGDVLQISVNLSKGSVHMTVTDDTGSVLYDNDTAKEDTEITIEKSGTVTLSYEKTIDADGKMTMYRE